MTKYAGRAPDSDSSVITKGYTDTRYSTIKVDNAYISTSVANQAVPLTNQAYVDTQDNLRAKKAAVDTADGNYLAKTQIDAANGLVPLDVDAYIPAANLGTVATERKPVYIPGTITLSGDRNVSTTTAKEYQAGSLTIADPGYPYIPLFFAQVLGGSVLGTAASRASGTGSFGQISVLRTDDDAKYAWTLCTAHKGLAYHTAFPYADNLINPGTRPPLTGTTNWALWLGLWNGTTYTFNSTGMVFYVLVIPGA